MYILSVTSLCRQVFMAREKGTNEIVALKKVRMDNEKEGVGWSHEWASVATWDLCFRLDSCFGLTVRAPAGYLPFKCKFPLPSDCSQLNLCCSWCVAAVPHHSHSRDQDFEETQTQEHRQPQGDCYVQRWIHALCLNQAACSNIAAVSMHLAFQTSHLRHPCSVARQALSHVLMLADKMAVSPFFMLGTSVFSWRDESLQRQHLHGVRVHGPRPDWSVRKARDEIHHTPNKGKTGSSVIAESALARHEECHCCVS